MFTFLRSLFHARILQLPPLPLCFSGHSGPPYGLSVIVVCASQVHDLQVKSEMSPRNSSSHHSPSDHRCNSNLLAAPASFPEFDFLSSVFESVQAPGYQQQEQQQGSFPSSDSSWRFHSPVQSLGNVGQSTQSFPIPLYPDISSLSLNSGVSLAGTILDPDTPLQSLEDEQSFNSVNREEQLTDENPQSVLNA